jgi:hypothetical protein
MKLSATIARSLRADMQAELRDIERAVITGTREADRGLKTELRRQLASAGLGQRLANSWRDKHYPNQKLDAASLVYTKAPQIIRAFDEGALIRSRRGRFLASLPDLSAEGERDGFYQGQLIRELAVRPIMSWKRVELEGGPAPPTPENNAAVMELHPVGERFFQEVTLRQVLLNAAKRIRVLCRWHFQSGGGPGLPGRRPSLCTRRGWSR